VIEGEQEAQPLVEVVLCVIRRRRDLAAVGAQPFEQRHWPHVPVVRPGGGPCSRASRNQDGQRGSADKSHVSSVHGGISFDGGTM